MNTPDWVADSVFYQIFPDRFAKSDRVPRTGLNLEAWDAPPSVYGIKGGDLYGVLEHLDYLVDLGVNALYLNPVFASASNHRYHTYDYFVVDPLLGGNNALRELLDAAHRRSIRVILDGVFNHASRGLWQFHHTLENGSSSPYVDWFHFERDRLERRRHWGAYPSPEQEQAIHSEGSFRAIGYQGWWDMPALPKFNTNTPAVREFLFSVGTHWIEFGADGWRLDVPGEINDDSFWQEFRHRTRSVNPDAYIVGEVWHDGSRWLQGDQFDACTNYLVTSACISFLAGSHLNIEETERVGGFRGWISPLDAQGFADRMDWILGLYRPEVNRVQLNHLDSHDTPRFLTCAHGDEASLRLAMLFLLTFPGAPCIFYGDEVGLQGGHEPDCRKAFVWDENSWDRDLRDFAKNLIRQRRIRKEWRWGNLRRLCSARGVYAYARELDQSHSVTVLNTAEEEREVDLDLWHDGQPELKVVAGSATIMALQPLRLRVPARTGAVLSVDPE